MTISELPLLNCDMGESFGAWTMGLDAEVMPFVDCANIACGFHASDPSVMRRTVELALRYDVMIGAHPAYPDLVGFGRRSMACSSSEVRDLLQYQIGALDGICKSLGGGVRYVKPHGALYNDMMRDPALLETVMAAVAEYGGDKPPALMVLALRDNSTAGELAKRHGVSLMFEAFSDRRYSADGRLVPRSEPGAVLDSESSIVAQAEDLAAGKGVTCADGSQLLLNVDTICVHGDNAASVSAARAIRAVLDDMSGRTSR